MPFSTLLHYEQDSTEQLPAGAGAPGQGITDMLLLLLEA
jgi:hypothetical protein